MKVRLNLATVPAENQRRFLLGAGMAGAGALLLLVVLGVHIARTLAETRAQRERLAHAEQELSQLLGEQARLQSYFARPDTRAVLDRVRFVNDLLEQKNLPWTQMLLDLGSLLPPGVRVVELAPQTAGHALAVKMTVEAVSDGNKLAFLRAIQRAPAFTHLQVTAENRTGSSAGGHVQLQLELLYTGAGRTP